MVNTPFDMVLKEFVRHYQKQARSLLTQADIRHRRKELPQIRLCSDGCDRISHRNRARC